jgi:hypothetical protein
MPIDQRPVASSEVDPDLPPLSGADVLTLREAAAQVRMAPTTLRYAIWRGELAAFIPRGRDPIHAGPTQGYRIYRADLQRWYFGAAGSPKPMVTEEYIDKTARQNGPIEVGKPCPWCGDMVTGPEHSRSHD